MLLKAEKELLKRHLADKYSTSLIVRFQMVYSAREATKGRLCKLSVPDIGPLKEDVAFFYMNELCGKRRFLGKLTKPQSLGGYNKIEKTACFTLK